MQQICWADQVGKLPKLTSLATTFSFALASVINKLVGGKVGFLWMWDFLWKSGNLSESATERCTTMKQRRDITFVLWMLVVFKNTHHFSKRWEVVKNTASPNRPFFVVVVCLLCHFPPFWAELPRNTVISRSFPVKNMSNTRYSYIVVKTHIYFISFPSEHTHL